MPDEPGRDLAVPPDASVAEVVYDGEVIDERAAAGVPRLAAARSLHPVVRHGGYVLAGVVVIGRRWHHRRTFHHRAAEMAMATGDHATALQWKQQHALERHQRHERFAGKVEAFVTVVRVSPFLLAGWLICMGLLGVFLAIARHNLRDLAWPWLAMARAVAFGVELATATAYAVLILIPLGVLAVLAALYAAGRSGGSFAPSWAATSADPDADVSIDERTVTQAVANLRIPQIRDYLGKGMPLQFLVPCRQEGRGTYFEIRLPGVPAEKIVRRRADFAAGLYRLPKEVWPSMGSEAAILRGWIADKGALAEGAGPYPLLAAGVCDVFKGVPFGRTLRGDPTVAPLMERNTIAGGMPGQGKSSAARVIMIGAGLDPSAELWILIPDTNFDFEAMKRRCSRYVMGAEDERVETIRDWLSDLKDEVQRRGQKLIDFEVPAVTRKLASAGIGLHPLFVLLEEAHVAITHHVYGKEISGLLVDIVKLGRKRGIHLIVSTQAPTKDSMPRDVTRNCSNGIAFAVGDHVANDALLGQGAYAGGHRATELIPGTDRGTALCKGFSGERSEMVQVYFIDVAQVPPLIDRALAEIARLGRGVPGGPAPLPAIEARSLLDDLAEVMKGDDEPVRLSVLAVRLQDLAKSWGPYRSLTGTALRDLLDDEGVRTTNTGNVPRLDPEDLRRVLAEREN